MAEPLAKTALFSQKIKGGMVNIEDQSLSTGNRFFVDAGASGVGSTASYGNNPEAPLATWALAFSLDVLTASQGDIVYLMPGHVESVIAAGTITCDIAGVKVQGLGDKDNRPIISFTTVDSADIDIDAADITFENISFRCNIASLLAAIDVNASGFTIRNCSFMGTDAADEAFLISIITDAAADDITIEDCQFHYLNAEDGTAITTTSTECIRLVGADRAKIQRNYISGDFTTSAINSITTASDDLLILNNNIQNIATENITGGIDLHASTTGFMDGNMLYVADPTDPEDAIDDGACAIGVNWVTNVIGTAPVIWGAASSGGVEGKIDTIDTNVDSILVDTGTTLPALLTGSTRSVQHEVTFTAGGDGSVGSHALFTVTGAVRLRVIAHCTTSLTIQAGATLEVGYVGATTAFIALTAGDTIDVGEIWHDATSDAIIEANSVYTTYYLGGSTDITFDVRTDTIDTGVIEFVCEYEPVTTGATVVAA